MRTVCWQTILMKYTLFFSKIRKDVTNFVVCCSHDWRFKDYILYKTEILSVTSLLIYKVPAILLKQRISKYNTTNSGYMFEYNKASDWITYSIWQRLCL